MQRAVPSAGPRVERVLAAFTGGIKRPRVSLAYRAGVLLVLMAMLVLPLAYLMLVGGVLLVLKWHLVEHLSWTDNSSGRMMVWTWGMYLMVAAMIGAVVVCLVKPLFASAGKKPRLLTLDARGQPALFALIERICELTGAPMPREVHVDADVNASASFRRGLLSCFGNDLVLTIGMPLAAGLTCRQLAGVLAHELGHFAQGAGMRANYAVRRIQGWFSDAVYVRDGFDDYIQSFTDDEDWRVSVVGKLTQAMVGTSRLVLRGLMMVSSALSGYMSRQMEHDADAYEAELVGSEEFARTAMRLRVLCAAHEKVLADAERLHRQRELPDNLPRMLRHVEEKMPAPLLNKLRDLSRDKPAPWYGTHPNDADRIAVAKKRQAPGVFALEAPASELFEDFDELCRMVSVYWYEAELGIDLDGVQLLAVEGARESLQADDKRKQALQRFFGAEVEGLQIPPLPAAAAEQWPEACQAAKSAKPGYGERVARQTCVKEKAVQQAAGICLLDAGYTLDRLACFELNMISPVQARQGLEQTLAECRTLRAEMRTYRMPAATRLAAALAWRYSHEAGVPDAWRQRVCGLVSAQRVLAQVSDHIDEITPYERATAILTEVYDAQGNREILPQIQLIEAKISHLFAAVMPTLQSTLDPLDEAQRPLAATLMGSIDMAGQPRMLFSHLENAVQGQQWRVSGELALLAAEVEVAWETATRAPQPQPVTSLMQMEISTPHSAMALAA